MSRETMSQILDMSKEYSAAMKGEWDPLKEFYKNAMAKPVTVVLDTVLHIVAHSRQPELMKILIQVSSEALNVPNNVGNTVLYEAATSGDVEMAKVVLEANKEMLTAVNKQGENPLFGAAANGHTAMLRYLASQFEKGEKPRLRREDSTTILHIAILGQYHETALEILKLYSGLDGWRDNNGLTGLHLLAGMPFTFRSGCYMGFAKKLIYSCIPTETTEAAAIETGKRGNDVETGMRSHGDATTAPWFSSNYSACRNIACYLRRALHHINIKVWDCLSHGWPVFREACEQKKRHAVAVQLVKKLVAKDVSWMESHIGGDPYKISVFNVREVSKGHSSNPPHNTPLPTGTLNAHGGEGLQSTQLPLMTTHSGTLPHAPSSPDVDDSLESPSESPPMIPSKSLSPPMIPSKSLSKVTDDDSFKIPSRPPMEGNDLHTSDDDDIQSEESVRMSDNDDNYESFQPPMTPPMDKEISTNSHGKETPLLIAAGKGIVEIVEEILAVHPQAVEYVNDKGCNILHEAVRRRQTQIFKLVRTRDTIPLIRLNRRIDEDGNSVLHHAAKLDEKDPQVNHLRNIPGEALQMQWEIQWFKQVMEVVPSHFRNHLNKDGEKAEEVFTKCHKELAKNGEKWLMRTANSCSLVATLIATVAFTSAYTVPGGPNQKTGHPLLINHPAFLFFTVSDTISLSFALTSVVVFLSIMTSRFHEQDFHLTLPLMLVVGLTSLFLAVSAMMVSFAATLVLMITQKLRQAAIPIFLVACFPVTIFLVLQFPLYVRVAWYTIGDILNKLRRSFSTPNPPKRGFKQD